MPTVEELRFRDCPRCGYQNLEMRPVSTCVVTTVAGRLRAWCMLASPRCAGVVTLELDFAKGSLQGAASGLPGNLPVSVAFLLGGPGITCQGQSPPRGCGPLLPRRPARDRCRGARCGGRAAQENVGSSRLKEGRDGSEYHAGEEHPTAYRRGLHYEGLRACAAARSQGRHIGAHHTDEQLTDVEVLRALRFTTQVLRNLFEVPGELAELEAAAGTDPDTHPDVDPGQTLTI
jgi:hypothetical protein